MGTFKTSRTGGNVVHRIDLGGGARRRPRTRRRPLERSSAGLARDGGPSGRRDPDAVPGAVSHPLERVRLEPAALDRPLAARAPARDAGARDTGSGDTGARDTGARRQIDLLERRLAKMTRLLEERDQEVAMVRAGPAEDGVASVFREVQGIEGSGQEVERKKALMSRIFEANLDLRKQIISG